MATVWQTAASRYKADLGQNSLSGHDLHGLVWARWQTLFLNGDRGYNCTTQDGRVLSDPNSGAVFRCKADGSEMEIYYYGLRNPQEIAFNEYVDLFTVDNNCDQAIRHGSVIYWKEATPAGIWARRH